MFRRNIAALLLCLPLFSAGIAANAEPERSVDKVLIAKKHKKSGGEIAWAKTMEQALSQAGEAHKLVFVDVGAVW